jgi:hypothetical protein
VKWNVWISGLQCSRSALRREKSCWKRVMRSFRRISSRWLPLGLTTLQEGVLQLVAWNK